MYFPEGDMIYRHGGCIDGIDRRDGSWIVGNLLWKAAKNCKNRQLSALGKPAMLLQDFFPNRRYKIIFPITLTFATERKLVYNDVSVKM